MTAGTIMVMGKLPRVTLRSIGYAVMCFVWGASLGGCSNHPLAQRSATTWQSVRVLPGSDPTVDEARPQPVDKESVYYLAREWEAAAAKPTAGTGELTLKRAYLTHGEPLGFDFNAEGQVVAVAGQNTQVLAPIEGAHFVWYRERPHLGDGVGDGLLQTVEVVGAVALTAGLVFVIWALDDDCDDDHHHHQSNLSKLLDND